MNFGRKNTKAVGLGATARVCTFIGLLLILVLALLVRDKSLNDMTKAVKPVSKKNSSGSNLSVLHSTIAHPLHQEDWYKEMLSTVSGYCKHLSHFFHHFLPHTQCQNPVRVGKCQDGSKFICMDHFDERNTKRAIQAGGKCIVYSFGSSDDSCFESDMADRTDCEIHIFDPTSSELKHPRWTYHSYGLTGEDPDDTKFWNWRTQKQAKCDGCPMKNLEEIMKELNHNWIDVLKVDIDGAEWRSFEYIYNEMKSLPASQLQFELTGLDITDQSDSLAGGTAGVYNLWENIINDGFQIFNIEANKGTCTNRRQDRSASFEYALMKV
jgi:Methyltransferase domain